MGGFACPCGAGVKDSSDYLSYKAHLIADQDFEDFQETSAASKAIVAHNLVKATVYLCSSELINELSFPAVTETPDGPVGYTSCSGCWRAPNAGSSSPSMQYLERRSLVLACERDQWGT